MMSGQQCREEQKKNTQNDTALVPNGKLCTSSLLQRSRVGNHSIQHSRILFQKYIDFLKTAHIDWKDSEKNAIIQSMERRFAKADPSFLSSKDFELLITSTIEDMKRDMNCSFVYIRAFIEELKSYKLKRCAAVGVSVPHNDSAVSQSSKNESLVCNVTEPCSAPCSSSVTAARTSPEVICVDSEDEETTMNSHSIGGHVQSESTKSQLHNHCEMRKDTKCQSNISSCANSTSNSLAGENVQQATVGNSVEKQTVKEVLEANSMGDGASLSQNKMKHIQKLEKLMAKIDKKIKKLQEKELTLEDMDEESDYILEDRLKNKFVKVWEEWCRQVGRSSKAGYETQKRFHYEASRYPSINAAVEKFMNKKKVFPDFCDILNVVTAENTSSNLCLTETQCHSIARDIFSDVGKKLKERRCRDFVQLFGCYLTDDVSSTNDPADHDEKLRLELDHNKKESEEKLDKLLESYVQMQEDKSGTQEDGSTSPDEDNDDEEEEVCSIVDEEEEEASLHTSDERSCDELVPDSLETEKGSLTVKAQNNSANASSKKHPSTLDAKPSLLSNMASAPSLHIGSNSPNSDEVSKFQSFKQKDIPPKQATDLKNVLQKEPGLVAVNPKKPTSFVCDSNSAAGSYNNSKASNSLGTNSKIKSDSLVSGKSPKLKTVELEDHVTTQHPQNDCRSSVSTVTKLYSVSKSAVNPGKTSITAVQNSCQSISNPSHCITAQDPLVNFSKQMSGNATNGPSSKAEEIWIVSSSDSDASTEPTPDVETKSVSNSKYIPSQPCSSKSRTRQLGNSHKTFHQSSNSSKPRALKSAKRISTVSIQEEHHIPDKKLCLSSVFKS